MPEITQIVLKVLIVDLSAIFWGIALGSAAQEFNAPFERTLERIRKYAEGFDRIAICCDPSGPSFRHKLFAGYKADRRQRPEHLWRLLADVKRQLAADGYHIFEADDFEADDSAATVAAHCAAMGWPCRILSTDSDLTQAVRAGVEYQRADTGEVLNAEGVKAWLKVLPDKVAELKALAGDGDGYKPFPGWEEDGPDGRKRKKGGIGDAGAVMLLERFGSAVGAVQAALSADGGGIKPHVREVLRRGGISAAVWGLKLASIRYDVPLNLEQLVHARPANPVDRGVGANLLPLAPVTDAQWEEPPRTPSPPPPPSAPPVAMVRAEPSYGGLAAVGSTSEAEAELRRLQEFIKRVLVRGVDGDYGPIPGCKKDVLRQPGAQKMAEFYGLSHSFEIITSIRDWEKPLFFYEVRCKLTSRRDGRYVGEGLGSCNSRESKYAGRWAYERQVPAHLDKATLKTKTFRDRKGQLVTQYRVPNEDIFDQVNTVLKMACKRAYVAAVISVTRSSGIFTQDMEDMPPPEDTGEDFRWAEAG